jgi:prophage tail gpP-like protein
MSNIIVRNATTGQELLWRSIKINKSLDEICHTLELEIPPSERAKVKRHHRLEVRCENNLVRDSGGKRLVTTVLVDDVTANTDKTKNSLMIIGRSPARDIIDSTWSDTCDDMTLREITRYIGDKFNIVCDTFPTDQPDPTEKIYAFDWENESPWTKLIGEADNQGYIFTSNEKGHLYLWKADSGNRVEPFHITEGINVKNIRWTENGSEQFHEYVVTGGGDEARVIDNTCGGNRILTIDLPDPFENESETELEKILKRRAETEMRRRKKTKTIITVSGWGLTDEQIKSLGETSGKEIYWFPNALIPVKVPSLGLNTKLLVSEVEYTANSETVSCDVTLVNREAYL